MRVCFRPTVAADLAAVTDQPLPHRIKAITALDGETLLGVGGIGYQPSGTVIAFAHITAEGRRYPVAIHRAGKVAMRLIEDCGAPLVVAEAQSDNPAAVRWLERLGFRHFRDQVFVWRRR